MSVHPDRGRIGLDRGLIEPDRKRIEPHMDQKFPKSHINTVDCPTLYSLRRIIVFTTNNKTMQIPQESIFDEYIYASINWVSDSNYAMIS